MIDYSQLIEQYAAAADLAEQERAQADALFLSIGDGAIATDADGKINRINDAALEILGYKREDLMGKWFPKTIVSVDKNGDRIATIDRPITKAFLTGKPVSAAIYYLTKQKTKLPVYITVSPILLNDRPIGAIEVFRDITHEHEVDRMKSEFISIASHQLRTPLTAINTYARMLDGGYVGKLNKEQQDFVRTIITSVTRMNELITALLDISRIESGSLQLKLSKLDYTTIVKAIVAEVAAEAEKKNIRVTVDVPDKPVVVKTDPVLLPEICANLVSNSLKYTPAGGKITVKLKETAKKQAVLSVKDTGYGIPKETQYRVFTKFYRGENIVRRETSGTGLGLYLVKLIADTMGGKVWFKSESDKGSTFYFSLPLSPRELSR